MNSIIAAAESMIPPRNPDDFGIFVTFNWSVFSLFLEKKDSLSSTMSEVIGHTTYTVVQQFKKQNYTGKILVIGDSTFVARMVSKYRPNMVYKMRFFFFRSSAISEIGYYCFFFWFALGPWIKSCLGSSNCLFVSDCGRQHGNDSFECSSKSIWFEVSGYQRSYNCCLTFSIG